MGQEFRALCKDCGKAFGYSLASVAAGATMGLTRPERCPACRRIHSREGKSIGIPQIAVKPTGPRKPDKDLNPGRLGKIFHPERVHTRVTVEGSYGKPDSHIQFGITDEDIRLLIQTMLAYQVTVVVGPTGSGKSTFLPYRLMVPPDGIEPDVFTRHGQILVTQPRIPATRSIARFVATDLHGCSLGAGFDVGFRHSNAPASDWRNKLVYATDGTLINWIVDGQISNLSVIMIDEAHERSLNIDIILGLLKQQLPRYPHLKLIIASATINAELFQTYFGGPDRVGLLRFKGLKQHQVDAYFPPLDIKISPNPRDRRIPDNMAGKIQELLIAIARGEKKEGDILGFLPGQGEIALCIERLREGIAGNPELRKRGIRIYPLFSQLPQDELDLALAKKTRVICDKILAYVLSRENTRANSVIGLVLDQRSAHEAAGEMNTLLQGAGARGWQVKIVENGKAPAGFPKQILFATPEQAATLPDRKAYLEITDRRVIVSTNLAETSLTVDGIVYVVDSGLIKEASWLPEHAAAQLSPVFHSRAGCRQRMGRAGRIRDGEAYMLYTDEQFEDPCMFPAHTTPEIQRSPLEAVALKLKAAGIRDVAGFDWIQAPPEEELKRAPEVLKNLAAVDEDGDLTDLGLELNTFSTEIDLAHLLLNADRLLCGIEMATLAALLPFRFRGGLMRWDQAWDFETRHRVEGLFHRMAGPCGDDLEFLFKIYAVWKESPYETIRDYFCRLFFIDEARLAEVELNREKYLDLLSIGKKGEEDRPIHFWRLDGLRILLTTGVPDACLFVRKGQGDGVHYQDLSGKAVQLQVDRESVLSGNVPECFVALKRQVVSDRSGQTSIRVSHLVRVDPAWLGWRGISILSLAGNIAEAMRPLTTSDVIGEARRRLFLDVVYPVGSRFEVLDLGGDETLLGQAIALPIPLEPTMSEREFEQTVEGDDLRPSTELPPLAGWDDKQDAGVAYDPSDPEMDLEGGDLPDTKLLSLTARGGREDVEGDYADGVEDMDAGGAEIGDEGRMFGPTLEILASRRARPTVVWREGGKGGSICEIVGYDASHAQGPRLVVAPAEEGEGQTAGLTLLKVGKRVTVEPLEVLDDGGRGVALEVRETESGARFIVEAEDLGFVVRPWLVKAYHELKEFDALVLGKGTNRFGLSRLPIAFEEIRQVGATKRGHVTGRVVERTAGAVFFQVAHLPPKAVHLALMIERPWVLKEYQEGNSYDLVIDPRRGETSESIALLPNGLLPFVMKERFRRQIFWNPFKKRLHTKKPMTFETKERLLELSRDHNYVAGIEKLYRASNRLRVYPSEDAAYAQRALEFDSSVQDRKLPCERKVYTTGQIIRGRVAHIYHWGVLVVLDHGGRGAIPLAHLSWERLLDPREVVYAGQELRLGIVKDEDDKIHCTLLIDPKACPASHYRVGDRRQAVIQHVQDDRIIAQLDQGGIGILDASKTPWAASSDLTRRVVTGQEIRVRIDTIQIDLEDENRPLKIGLSLPTEEMRVQIPKRKIAFLIGRGGENIKSLCRQSGCRIWCEEDGAVWINGLKEQNMEAIRLIRQQIPEAAPVETM